MRKPKPVTPGDLVLEEFLKPMGISQYRLAKIKPWDGMPRDRRRAQTHA